MPRSVSVGLGVGALLLVGGGLIWGLSQLGGDPSDPGPLAVFEPEPTEVDDPAAYPYSTTRTDCSQYDNVTDAFTVTAAEFDRFLRQATPIPDAEEVELGDQVLAELPDQMGGRLVSTGSDVAYLTGVMETLLPHAQRQELPWQVHLLVETEVVNALALPGGRMVVTQPFLEQWPANEAQLAAVLGHEISHVDERHPVAMHQYVRALGLPEDQVIPQLVLHLARAPYSSNLEEQADALGADMLFGAGYSVFQAVELWRAQSANEGGDDAPPQDLFGVLGRELENLTQTHPDSAKRACLLEIKANALYAQDPDADAYVGETNLRRRTPMRDKKW